MYALTIISNVMKLRAYVSVIPTTYSEEESSRDMEYPPASLPSCFFSICLLPSISYTLSVTCAAFLLRVLLSFVVFYE
jgi:hypothetical protein